MNALERELHAIDEILQVMFWLRGEGLLSSVTATDLGRFVALAPEEVGQLFNRMEGRGLVEKVEKVEKVDESYRLTTRGVREGGRRFRDEFAELTRPGHGECGDPDCECQRTGRLEDCRHATKP